MTLSMAGYTTSSADERQRLYGTFSDIARYVEALVRRTLANRMTSKLPDKLILVAHLRLVVGGAHDLVVVIFELLVVMLDHLGDGVCVVCCHGCCTREADGP